MATDVERLVVRLEATQRQFEKQLAAANNTANRRALSIERRFQQMNRNISASFRGLAAPLAAAFSVQGAQRLIDTATRIDNALKVAGLSGAELDRVYQRLFQSAQANAAPLESLVTLYGRAAIVQKELGVSTEELLSFTNNVALALRVAGTDAQSASGALLQLSQALGSGTVRAEEFNSILEGALPIAQAAAAGLEEAGGSVAKLRALVVDGAVSSEAFFRAFEAGSVILEDKVAGSAYTVSQQFQVFANELVNVAREFNQTASVSDAAGDALEDLATIIRDVAAAAQAGIEWLQSYTSWIGNLGDAAWNAGAALRELLGLPSVGDALGINRALGTDVTQPTAENIQSRIDAAFGGSSSSSSGATDIGTIRKPNTVSLKSFPVSSGGGGGGRRGGGGGGRSRGDSWQREIEQIKERTAAIQAMTAAQAGINPLVEDYGYAVEKAAAVVELETAAKKAGLQITPQLKAQIEELAGAYATASAEAEKLAERQNKAREMADDMRALGKDVLGGFIQDLRNGVDASESLANALQKVADKLLDIALNNIFDGGGGGGGGFLGGLLGGIGNFFGFAEGGIARNGRPVMGGRPLKRFAHGGISNEAAIFGEGPMAEAAVPLPDGRRIPVDLRMPEIPRRGVGEEIVRVVLQDDSGRMAQIADQRIQTAAGPIIQISVEQSTKTVQGQMPNMIANAQARSL